MHNWEVATSANLEIRRKCLYFVVQNLYRSAYQKKRYLFQSEQSEFYFEGNFNLKGIYRNFFQQFLGLIEQNLLKMSERLSTKISEAYQVKEPNIEKTLRRILHNFMKIHEKESTTENQMLPIFGCLSQQYVFF